MELDKTKDRWKIVYKKITIKKTVKYSTNTNLTALSNGTVKKAESGEDAGGKKWIYIFKAKERKQYKNNGTESLFVVIIYLTEAFKMRFLWIAESSESSKKQKCYFWVAGQIFKRWINAWYADKEGPSSIFKIGAAQEKMFIVFNLQTPVT